MKILHLDSSNKIEHSDTTSSHQIIAQKKHTNRLMNTHRLIEDTENRLELKNLIERNLETSRHDSRFQNKGKI